MNAALIHFFGLFIFSLGGFDEKKDREYAQHLLESTLSFVEFSSEARPVVAGKDSIVIEKDFIYDRYILEDAYPYRKTSRHFQWDKIRAGLAHIDSIQQNAAAWGIIQNRHNKNGEAASVKNWKRNQHNRVADEQGVERYQSAPLYAAAEMEAPERYERDGTLVKYQQAGDEYVKLESVNFEGEWYVPRKYIKPIRDSIKFIKVIAVDRTNQNITTLEKNNSKWLVRSMDHATTGLNRPPYQHETPLGIFVIQEKKKKMFYYKDGTEEIGGFAPYASRFCNGGYIHGIPVNKPREEIIERSGTLGTTPRSHMCVRNASSHAAFIYDWGPVDETLVFVFD